MIDRSDRRLSLSAQCQLLHVSRSSVYYRPKGESAETLALMQHAHSDDIRTVIPILSGQGFRRHPDMIPGHPDKHM